MKVAVFYGKEDVRIEDRPKPKAGSNQIVVKMDYVGLCGTDVEAFKTGSFLKRGMVLGHENIGTVVDIGEDVNGFSIGDHLLCGPPTFCDELCPACKRGETNICRHALEHTRGIGGPDGGYAEYMLIHDVKHTVLRKLPEGIDLKDAVLFDVVCVGIHAIRLSRFRFGDDVVVSGGGGPVGLSMVRLLKLAGAKKIAVLQTGTYKIDILKKYGADLVIDPNNEADVKGKLVDFFGTSEAADITFECAGTKQSLKNCLEYATRSGGQVVLVGEVADYLDNIIPADSLPLELDMQISFVFTARDIEIYTSMLTEGKIDFPEMITDVIPLSNVVEKGLALEHEERRKQIKILIDPS